MSAPRHVASEGSGPRYERVTELTSGGMAVLELARTIGAHGFEKYVAIKRISPKWADDPEFIRMFLDEARLAAVLDHPNVVRVHDLGHDSDGPFFVMDYIHGEDLLALLRKGGALAIEHALAIGIAAATGLHHAHTRRDFEGKPLRIIHRDVSLSNILVTYDGGVKLVDFGIAKAASGDGTRASVRKGKVGYMSPEQCKGGMLDGRSDVFSLGIVLWELLAGKRLFHDENEFTSMNRIVNHDAPSLRDVNPEVPIAIADAIHRALARDPEQRYEDARAMARALERAGTSAGIHTSSDDLAALMSDVFGSRPYPWESGNVVEEAVTETGTDPTRIVTPQPDVPAPAPSAPPRGRTPLVAIAIASVLVGGVGFYLIANPDADVDPATAARSEEPERPAPESKPPAPVLEPEPAEPAPEPEPEPEPAEPEPAEPERAEPDPEPEPQRADAAPKPEPKPKPKPKPKPAAKKRRPNEPPEPKDEPQREPAPEAFDPDGLGPVRSVLE